MLNLILKDFLIQKKTVLFSLGYMLILLFAFQKTPSAVFAAGLVGFTYMLVNTSSLYDDKYKSDVLLNCLPINRKTIVSAKYLTLIVYIAIGSIVYSLTIFFIKLVGLPIRVVPISFASFIGALFAVSLLNSIYFPVLFKFGFNKTRYLNFILFFVFFFGAVDFKAFIKWSQGQVWATNIAAYLKSQTDLQIDLLILAITVVGYFISYLASLKFYAGREF